MNKDRFLELYKQYAHETCFLSYHDMKHPAYIELRDAGPSIIPWVLQRLKDSVGRDSGDAMDRDNDPWLSTCLLGDLAPECWDNFPHEFAGQLGRIRTHLLKWGQSKGLITI